MTTFAQNKKSSKRGFSIVETLVAITVLLIAVVAPMSLAADGVRAARLAQDQIVAFYLAQEGIELVKNKRDDVKLASASSAQLSNLGPCLYDNGAGGAQRYCYIDALDLSVSPCAADDCPNIRRINDGIGTNDFYLYTYGLGAEDTKYVRTISVWYLDAAGDRTETPGSEAIVEVTVSWPFVGGEKEHVVRNVLTDW